MIKELFQGIKKRVFTIYDFFSQPIYNENDNHRSYDDDINKFRIDKNEYEKSLSSKRYLNKKVDTKRFDNEREIYVLNVKLDLNDDYFEDDENYDANDALVSLEGYQLLRKKKKRSRA
jgi:hypothetical protein